VSRGGWCAEARVLGWAVQGGPAGVGGREARGGVRVRRMRADVGAPACVASARPQSLQALVLEVQAKTSALLESERRCAEVEGILRSVVARAS
jgi:hypothetical protein